MRDGPGIEAVIREFRRRAYLAMEEIRRDAVADLKVLTGVQGPPRSLPGEPPRMDTTTLNHTTTSTTINQGSTITVIIAEDTPYARALELGNPENNLKPRPHMSLEMQRTKTRAEATLIRHLGGGAHVGA